MYVTGRWVSTNVVSTMFVAWLFGVIVFVAFLVWQRRKHRKGKPDNGRRRGSLRSLEAKKTWRRRRRRS